MESDLRPRRHDLCLVSEINDKFEVKLLYSLVNANQLDLRLIHLTNKPLNQLHKLVKEGQVQTRLLGKIENGGTARFMRSNGQD